LGSSIFIRVPRSKSCSSIAFSSHFRCFDASAPPSCEGSEGDEECGCGDLLWCFLRAGLALLAGLAAAAASAEGGDEEPDSFTASAGLIFWSSSLLIVLVGASGKSDTNASLGIDKETNVLWLARRS
jgi:hypothetical protein